MSIIQGLAVTGESQYQISRSLRFNSADSAYLNRTPGSTTNQKTWTFSCWMKRGTLGTNGMSLISAGTSNINGTSFYFSSDQLVINNIIGGGSQGAAYTSAVLRDPSSWYHIVLSMDTTQTSFANGWAKIYINGVQQTLTQAAAPTQNSNTFMNLSTNAMWIGRDIINSNYFNGYLTEINFIDGQALTPSSFGETDAATGVWKPKKYTGTYGTNGFYLNFSDNSGTTSTTLGKDSSGNGNNWTPNNFSVTAGAGNDSMTDVPTLTSESAANYAVLNPLIRTTNNSGSISQSDGNLSTLIGSYANTALGTIGVTSGKWYWEMTPTATNNGAYFYIGVAAAGYNSAVQPDTDALQWAYYAFSGNKMNNSNVAYGATYTTNDVIGVAIDMDAGTLTFYKNGTTQGQAFSNLAGNTVFPMCSFGNTGSITVVSNFGQRPFAYTPPTGFKALNTFNLPTPTIGATASTQAGKYFNPVLYTGDNTSAKSITGVGFQPDFVWIKARSIAYSNILYDVVRGTGNTKNLSSDTTSAEPAFSTNANLTSFDSDGFTVGSTSSTNILNGNTTTYVAWNWKANGAGSSNTAGTITSTVSANTTAGFSIVTYTGNGTNGATIGHGLGVKPAFMIIKYRGSTVPELPGWYVYHQAYGATKYTYLNSTAAAATSGVFLNDIEPTSSLVTLGTAYATNDASENYVAYCFAPVAGYSAFGSYTGNGSADGPFVFTNHRPAFLLIKRTDTTSNWTILDIAREGYNVDNDPLFPNLPDAEGTTDLADILSNGFKLRSTDASVNANTGTYIYMSLASNPFKYSLAR